MRTYYVRLSQSDFISDQNVYTSPEVDLYDNDSYTNFSVTRSGYGLNSLTDGTWTGLRQIDSTTTDSGTIVGSRFIDTTGRVDIVSWSISGTDPVDGPVVSPTIEVYTSSSSSAVFPFEYIYDGSFPLVGDIEVIGSPRYARFILTLDSPQSSFDLMVRVEIDQPVMAPQYAATRRLLGEFPEWMAIRELENTSSVVPELATPTSLGGAFLNSVAGQWLDDIASQLTYQDFQGFIQTVDLHQVAWVYQRQFVGQLWSFNTVGAGELARAADLNEFYEAVAADDDVLFWDEQNGIIYFGKNYTFTLNGAAVSGNNELHHVWNSLDDLGLFVDLHRLRLEGNPSFQLRILDVHRNKPGVGLENFKLAIRRELNIWSVYGSTPDSTYLGATPTVLEIADLEKDPLYITPEGIPTQRFIQLVDQLAVQYPVTWGRFKWDLAFWDIGGPNHEGFGTLPYRLDSDSGRIQSGVGDADDLLLLRPDAITGPHDFTARMKLRGYQTGSQYEYPPVDFDLQIYGQWDRRRYANPKKTIWLTVEITTSDPGNPVYVHPFMVSATSDVNVDRAIPSSSSYGTFRFFDDDGTGTDDALTFSSKTNGADYPGGNTYPGGKIPLAKIASVAIKAGEWTFDATPHYANTEGSDTFEVWFSHDPSQVLKWNTGAPTYAFNPSAPQSSIIMKSKVTSYAVERFSSEHFPYHIRLNDNIPATAPKTVTIAMPAIIWDPYQETVPNRQIVVEMVSKDAVNNPAAQTTLESGDHQVMPIGDINLNGSHTWTGSKQSFNDTVASLTLAVRTGATNYPVVATTAIPFEAVQTTSITAVVDVNGPWRNGFPSSPGNTNFALQTLELDRTDFGLAAHDSAKIVTWIGVEVLDDPRVIAWIDSNTVKPAITANTVSVASNNATFPTNAVVEHDSGTHFYYDPFILRVRLRTQPTPEWNPYIHSGWYYQGNREGYLYAEPHVETYASSTPVLTGVARQGAPILVRTTEATPHQLRQVCFFDYTGALTLTNTQVVYGNGTGTLYMSYADIHSVVVSDYLTGEVLPANATAANNQVTLSSGVTNSSRQYSVSYQVNRSFYANNEHEDVDGTLRTKLVFDHPPTGSYRITYEGSEFDPATPVDLPLSPLYTSITEGYVFLSHNEYTLDRVEVSVSPSKLVANGTDYLQVSIRSLDRYGNPKGNQVFTLGSTFGTFAHSTITTDKDGFAVAVLTAGSSSGSTTGTITISGVVNAALVFEIEPEELPGYRLLAVPAVDQIPANGLSSNVVYGRIENSDYQGYAGASIHWKRARSLYELFAQPSMSPATPVGQTTHTTTSDATPVPPPAATPVVTDDTTTVTHPGPPQTARGCMVGWIPQGNNYDLVLDNENTLGKTFAIVRYYGQFTVPSSSHSSDIWRMLSSNRLTVVSHKSTNWSEVASGAKDAVIDAMADYYNSFHKEIVFIFGHEPHDNASDVKAGGNYGTSAEYKAAWRRIVERFRARGANKVKFGYCASSPWPIQAVDKCYPGDDIIDVFAHDKYNWYDYKGSGWEEFETQWAPYVKLSKNKEKPLIIGEWGSHPSASGHDLNQWFRNAAFYIKNDPIASKWLIGFGYYHTFHTHDWRFIGQNTHGQTHGDAANNGVTGWVDGFSNDAYFKGTPFAIDPQLTTFTTASTTTTTAVPSTAAPLTETVVTTSTSTTTVPSVQYFAGTVTADANGRFSIGPFLSSDADHNGYWFLSAECTGPDTVVVGDVVFWHEYPDVLFGVEPFTQMPRASVQDSATPTPPYSYLHEFPSNYDEATPYASVTPVSDATPSHVNWLPPLWYALPKYQQYQLGLLGNVRGHVTYDPTKVRKFRKVI